ncbi:MAG TPA: hypothetical protein PLI57_05155, partial [Spirochaetota bacterium]|nr:hypothetical protein [Spirochaetota bacterium]
MCYILLIKNLIFGKIKKTIKLMNDYNLNEADYLLREHVNAIKGSIDQIYYGLLNYLSEDEQKKFLSYLKNQSDSLQDVLYKSIVERANK